MINRWQGNSGRVQRLNEPQDKRPPARDKEQHPSPPVQDAATGRGQAVHPRRTMPQSLPPLYHSGKNTGGIFKGLEGLKKLIPNKGEPLETEDIILLLILYLMYRESGDSELLMIMGAMFLL